MPVNDRGQIEQIIEQLKQAISDNELNRIRQLTEQLQQASHALTQQMYQQAEPDGNGGPQQGQPNTGGPTGNGSEEDVVEGEYRQV